MTRVLAATALICTLPALASAQDITLRADIARATVYAAGAELTREATVALPAGDTTVFIAMPDVDWSALMQVSAPDGVRLGPVQTVNSVTLAEGQLDTDAQAAARRTVETAEDAVTAAQDDLARSDTAIRAAEAQLSYLNALTRGGETGATMPEDPARVVQILGTLSTEVQRVTSELVDLRVARRDLTDTLETRQADLAAAQAALARLRPVGPQVQGIEITASSDTATDVVLQITYLTEGTSWAPSYDLRLDSDTGALEIERFITLNVEGPAVWRDVQVTFSTSNPSLQRSPQDVWSRPARLRDEPEAGADRSTVMGDSLVGAAPVPVMEPVLIMEDTAAMIIDGLSISYAYDAPVSVGPSGEIVLPFDALTLAMETEARAAPRFDDTAFLMAMGDNDSGAPILPGEARFYRDGALVGVDDLDLIAHGAEMELAFGALDHLRLVWIDRSLAEGDRGVFVSSNTQDRNLAFGVENTGDAAETVRILYAIPFAEQEALELDLTLSREPDERDIEDRRGVHAWQIEVAPGATEMVEMEVALTWPDGQVLDWQP